MLGGLGIAALAVPATAADRSFFLRLGGITAEGGKIDKKSGQQWVPVTSWFWGEYEVADGAPKVAAELQDEGFFDKGNVRISGTFAGCEVGKSAPEAVLKTPGVRYTFQDVVITRCKPTSLTINYGSIRSSASW
jgi:hypothetical protein